MRAATACRAATRARAVDVGRAAAVRGDPAARAVPAAADAAPGGFGDRPRGDRRAPGEDEDIRAYRQSDKPKDAPANNPFANFFKNKGDAK
jgi:hypothetical protein